ncbi:MAG TPA: hypothetical protein VI483_01960 [Candidatus Paceibacterota bacterium]
MKFSIPIAAGAVGVVVAFGVATMPALASASFSPQYCINYGYSHMGGDCASMYGGGNYSSYGYGYGYGYGYSGSYYQPSPYQYYPQPQPPRYTYQPTVPQYTYQMPTTYYYPNYPVYDYYDYYDFDAPNIYVCSGWCY